MNKKFSIQEKCFLVALLLTYIFIIISCFAAKEYGNGHFHKWEIHRQARKHIPSLHISGEEIQINTVYKCKIKNCVAEKNETSSNLW